jgi:hypothetical protein
VHRSYEKILSPKDYYTTKRKIMKKIMSIAFVFLFGVIVFAQDSSKLSEIKLFQGDEYMPYIFEPYQADYAITGKLIGNSFNLFNYQTQVIELKDGWSEIQNWQLPSLKDFKAEEVKVTQDIDLKTGLLKKILVEAQLEVNGEQIFVKQEAALADGKYASNSTATNNKGKVKASENYSFPVSEMVYPCNSNTFFSYLPLSNNFIGSFTCLGDEFNGNLISDVNDTSITVNYKDSFKDNLVVQKQTIKVFGSEIITTKAGTFDCYKIKQSNEIIGEYDKKGKFKTAKKNVLPKDFDENRFTKHLYGSTWIDKKTRKIIKSQFEYKNYGGLYIEMQPQKNVNL